MSDTTDLLVIGATGFTGRLVAKYLGAHRDGAGAGFTFALAGRSRTKLEVLVAELGLGAEVPLRVVDVTEEGQVEAAVKTARVVVNMAGPYLLWGTPVVRACVRNGIHYVDLTGETVWIKDVITQFDYQATQTGAVVIPSCGYDSLPSDLAAYLSVQTLKRRLGADTGAGRSVAAHRVQGSSVSGGTLTSAYVTLSLPRARVREALQDHWLSPARGAPTPPPRLVYTLPRVAPRIVGSIFPLAPANRSIVQRTRGLFEVEAAMGAVRYGPGFSYDEYFVTGSWLGGAVLSTVVLMTTFILGSSRVVRWLFKRLLVDKVQGASDEAMEKASGVITNVTASVATVAKPETWAKTVIRIRGDPGYLCTAVMIAECAIALLDTSRLTPLAKQGGVLTPASAFGDEIVKRLEDSGRFEFESSILE